MFLFRGTSAGWPGNPATQQFRVTPTTTNPFVATLFAIECQRFGSGLVIACLRSEVERFIGAANVLSDIDVAPFELQQRFGRWQCGVSQARAALLALGFEVPEYIGDKDTLNHWLNETPALSEQMQNEFQSRAFGERL